MWSCPICWAYAAVRLVRKAYRLVVKPQPRVLGTFTEAELDSRLFTEQLAGYIDEWL